MNKQEIRKFAKLVKSHTQKEAVAMILDEGYEFTVAEAQAAGIADPRRVVNTLRTQNGLPIYLNDRTLRNGERVKRFRLGTPRRNS